MRRTGLVTFAAVALVAGSTLAVAQIPSGVPSAQPRAGSPPSLIAHGFKRKLLAQGTDQLENPAQVYTRYGYLSDHSSQASGLDSKTEPDINTYLVTKTNPGGPTPGFDYGNRFLIQGHEGGGSGRSYLTRINLDVADPDHRITLLSPPGGDGKTGLSSLDGSSYYPFTGDLLFTQEAGSNGGVIAASLGWSSTSPPAVRHLDGSFGRGGYEGIHTDDQGNLYVAEDSGGGNVTVSGSATKVRQPNSFVYRFKPKSRGDLEHGRLQVLQILVDGTPITFHADATGPIDDPASVADALGEPIRRLHSGESLEAKWVTLHDTDSDGTASFDANALAKSKGATPLKRPENGVFVPGTRFRSFVFSETGDTNKDAGEFAGAAQRGAWGSILRLDMASAGAESGRVRTIVTGDAQHASFDNVTFLDEDTLLAGEDRGDTLHQQLNALDSIWSFDLGRSLSTITSSARRLLAEGRDPEATQDAANHEATPPVTDQNDGDNEVTGVIVSNGSPSREDILGAKDPGKQKGARAFYTQQHGMNATFEIRRKDRRRH